MEAVKQVRVVETLRTKCSMALLLLLTAYYVLYNCYCVFQGSATVGIKSKTHVVLVALKRSSSELSSYQKKIFPIDDHVAVSIAGLTSDGRMLR